MPKSCSAPECTSNKVKNTDLRFLTLPRPNPKTVPHRRVLLLAASYIREAASGKLWDSASLHAASTSYRVRMDCRSVLHFLFLFFEFKKHAALPSLYQ